MNRRVPSAALAAFLAACQTTTLPSAPLMADATVQPSPTAESDSTPAASTIQRASPVATVSPTASQGPVATGPWLEPGNLAAIVTSDLVVRSAPGVGADSDIQPVTLSAPSVVYVIDGPAAADGYVWYLVDPARAPWTLGDVPTAGWVAAAAKDGEPWIGPHEFDCEDAPTIEDLVTIAPQLALYCYAGRTLTVDAIANECGTVVGSGLPWGRVCQLFVPGQDPDAMSQGCVDVCAPWIEVWLNDLTPPVDGALVTVAGHFDDADAQDCAGAGGGATPLAVHRCRLAFVATMFSAP